MRTGVTMSPSWLLVLLAWGLSQSFGVQGQEVWNNPKFIAPTDEYYSEDVLFTLSSNDRANILLNEHAAGVILAVINYKGDNTPTSNQPTTSLGEVYVQDPISKLWLVNATRGLDFDHGTDIRIRLNIVIAGIPNDEGTLAINIENINDNQPIWQQNSQCMIKEGIAGMTDCFITITDVDGGVEDMTYTTLENNQPSSLFNVYVHKIISPNSVEIYLNVTDELDFETISLYSILITINDTYLNYTHIVSASYLVKVEDVPDEPPIWTNIFSARTINEKATETFQLTAIDGDRMINAEISYSLDDSPHSNITIDEKSGLLTVGYIDRDTEKVEVYKFVVRAYETDDTNSYIEADIVIMVNDINDHRPDISPEILYVEIYEEEAVTLSFNEAITIRDPDLGNSGSFNVKLQDSYFSSAFLLIPNSGYQEGVFTISVINTTELDYDRKDQPTPEFPKITLSIIATEVANPSNTDFKDVVILLKDKFDETPKFDYPEYFKNISENAKLGDTIIQVHATDADADDYLSYSMSQRDVGVNNKSGIVTLIKENAFDYERQTEMVVQVTVEDSSGNRAFADIILNILDVNDEAPTLDMPSGPHSVEEHTSVTIAEIKASDPDTDADLSFSIDWSSSYATKQGVRVQNHLSYQECLEMTGLQHWDKEWTTDLVVKNTSILDWEVFDTLYVSIVVTDTATDREYIDKKATARAILTLAINDTNDNAPEFNEVAYLIVSENSNEDQVIGRVTATDADGPGNNNITYSIEPLNVPPGMVMINPSSGDLLVNTSGSIDCEEYQSHDYMVFANDQIFSTPLKVTIHIRDENDNTPQVEQTIIMANIEEHSQDLTPITTIRSKDSDISEPFHRLTYILNTFDSFFYINPSTGELFVQLIENSELDREKKDTYEIKIIVRDNFEDGLIANTLFNETTVILTLDDVNDHDPEFPELSSLGVNLLETMKKDELVYEDLEAKDKDIGINADITYSVISTTAVTRKDQDPEEVNNFFRIETKNKKTADIKTNQDMIDQWGKYNIILGAINEEVGGEMVKHTYTIYIIDTNNHAPEFKYPTEGQTIRISNAQKLNSQLVDKHQNPIDNFQASDQDDPDSDNARLDFALIGSQTALEYFDVQTLANNEGRLILKKDFDLGSETKFSLQIEVKDHGSPTTMSKTVNIEVVVMYTDEAPPVFDESVFNISFTENSTGLSQYHNLPNATDKNNEYLEPGEAEDLIYYHIASDDKDLFNLDKNSGRLTLLAELDYEEETHHELYVFASNFEQYNGGEVNPNSRSVLKVNVEVIDVNDMPPKFINSIFIGGFSSTDDIGKQIVKLEAQDPDVDDKIAYTIVEVTGSDSLADKNNAFKLDNITGYMTLNFEPSKVSINGNFLVKVKATDSSGETEGHEDNAVVQIYVITDANRVKFIFNNPRDNITVVQNQVKEVFSNIFGYSCGIDRITTSSDASGTPVESETDVITNFINHTSTEPVDGSVIINQMSNGETMRRLTLSLSSLDLVLKSIDSVSNSATETVEGFLQIVLIAVSVVLGTMVVVLFAAFFVRTRTLNRRLEALSTTKFGSQESGLNRIGKVPNTNKHAVEGSNPVWNEVVEPDYDNMSEGSGDSDLIGIEDNPEFSSYDNNNTNNFGSVRGAENEGFSLNPEQSIPRRGSVNPLINMGVEGDIRRMSVNPLAASGSMNNTVDPTNFSFQNADTHGDSSEAHSSQANSNFIFGKPATEL